MDTRNLTREQIILVEKLEKGELGVETLQRYNRGELVLGNFEAFILWAIAGGIGSMKSPTSEELKEAAGLCNLDAGCMPKGIHLLVAGISMEYAHIISASAKADGQIYHPYESLQRTATAATASGTSPAMTLVDGTPWPAALINAEISVNFGSEVILRGIQGDQFSDAYKLNQGKKSYFNLVMPRLWRPGIKLNGQIRLPLNTSLPANSNEFHFIKWVFKGASLEEKQS